MDVLFLGFGFGRKVGSFRSIALNQREGGDGNREIPGSRALSCAHATWADSAGFRRGTLWGGVLSEVFRSGKFGAETSTSQAQVMGAVDERLGTSRVGILCDVTLR